MAGGTALLALSFVVVKHVARRFSQRLVGPSVATSIQESLTKFDSDKLTGIDSVGRFYGKALDVKRHKGEDDETYLRRLARIAETQATKASAKEQLVL